MGETLQNWLSLPEVQAAVAILISTFVVIIGAWIKNEVGKLMIKVMGLTSKSESGLIDAVDKIIKQVKNDLELAKKENSLEIFKIKKENEILAQMTTISNLGAKRLSADNKAMLLKLNEELKKYASAELTLKVEEILSKPSLVEEEIKAVEVEKPQMFL
jgi:hypothetical protein